jgi:hypothetical protein
MKTNKFPFEVEPYFLEFLLLFSKPPTLCEGDMKTNYIQRFVKALHFSEIELAKYAHVKEEYLSANYKEWRRQIIIDMSNAFWNGVKGTVKLSQPPDAHTMAGISQYVKETSSSLLDAVKKMQSNSTKYLFATPRNILQLRKLYRENEQRYFLDINGKDYPFYGLVWDQYGIKKRIILCDVKRFEDQASFPAGFENNIFLLDLAKLSYFLTCEVVESERGGAIDTSFSIEIDPSTSSLITSI